MDTLLACVVGGLIGWFDDAFIRRIKTKRNVKGAPRSKKGPA